ncbi:TetR family transcriptional regulator [Streptomyces purpurascens]
MRIWETVHLSLGADADRTASFFACGMLGNTLEALGLPPNAGRSESVPEG